MMDLGTTMLTIAVKDIQVEELREDLKFAKGAGASS
jgi:hypothetical protein